MLRTDLITIDPNITGGTPVFTGTRVPIKALFDHLAAGDSLGVFLDGFPSVSPGQAAAVVELAGQMLLPAHLHVAPAQMDFSFVDKYPQPRETAA